MSKKKSRKKTLRIELPDTGHSHEEKKPSSRHLMKDFLASLQLFFPAFFVIMLTAEILKYGYEGNIQNIAFPVLLLILGLASIFFSCLSGLITRTPYLLLPNFFFAFLFIVSGKIYLGYSMTNLLIASLIGILAFTIVSLFVQKDLWVKWIPEPIIKYLPMLLGSQLIFFGLLQSGIVRLSVLDPIKKTFGQSFAGQGAYFPLSIDTLATPTAVLLLLAIGLYIYLKNRNIAYPFLWTIGFIIIAGYILPAEWAHFTMRARVSGMRNLLIQHQPYRPEIIQLVINNMFGETGALNSSQWANFFQIIRSNAALLRFSMMSFFFLLFYSIFMHQSIQQSFRKIHPDTDRKDTSDKTFNRMQAFSGLFGIISSTTVFSYTEHSIFALFNKGKTSNTVYLTSLWILIALLLIPSIGFFVNPALMAFIWIIMGAQLLELSMRNVPFKQFQDYLVFIPMLLISLTTMNLAESLMIGILLYSISDIVLYLKDRKHELSISRYIWVGVVMIYFFLKVNAF